MAVAGKVLLLVEFVRGIGDAEGVQGKPHVGIDAVLGESVEDRGGDGAGKPLFRPVSGGGNRRTVGFHQEGRLQFPTGGKIQTLCGSRPADALREYRNGKKE